MDDFFSKINCDRCHKPLNGMRTMSMYSTEVICMECKEKETQEPDYKAAVRADIEQIKKGNYNFEGIKG